MDIWRCFYIVITFSACVYFLIVVSTVVKPFAILKHDRVVNNLQKEEIRSQSLVEKVDHGVEFNQSTSRKYIYVHVLQTILKFFPRSKLRDFPLTTLPDPYIIQNSQACTSIPNLDVIFLVSSATGHFEKRTRIRETWGNSTTYESANIRTVFVLGQPEVALLQEQIEWESYHYGDIIQGRFLDTYMNITHKTVLSIRWASENCLHSKLMAKVDDDVFVNVFQLLLDMDRVYSDKGQNMGCQARAIGSSPIVRTKGKWAIGYDYFKNQTNFPFVHCNGFFVAMKPSLARDLYELSKQTPVLRLDDVYLTGILPTIAGDVQVRNFHSVTQEQEQTVNCFQSQKRLCNITAVALSDDIGMICWFSVNPLYDLFNMHVRRFFYIGIIIFALVQILTIVRFEMKIDAILKHDEVTNNLQKEEIRSQYLVEKAEHGVVFNQPTSRSNIYVNDLQKILKFYPISKLHYFPLTTLPDPYTIQNSQACTSIPNLDVIFLVSSATHHFEKRTRIRKTWGNSSSYKSANIRTVFVLGQPELERLQEQIERESVQYGDIIQGRFLDTYKNLTHKTVLSIRWASENCLHSKLMAKVDDDVFVNVFQLLLDMDRVYSDKSRNMGCWARAIGSSPIVRRGVKWAIEYDFFKNQTHYPFIHCSGFFVAMKPSLARDLYELSKQTPVFRLDDVYLTGILPTITGDVHVQKFHNLDCPYPFALRCYTLHRQLCNITAVVIYKDIDNIMNTLWKTVSNIWSPL